MAKRIRRSPAPFPYEDAAWFRGLADLEPDEFESKVEICERGKEAQTTLRQIWANDSTLTNAR